SRGGTQRAERRRPSAAGCGAGPAGGSGGAAGAADPTGPGPARGAVRDGPSAGAAAPGLVCAARLLVSVHARRAEAAFAAAAGNLGRVRGPAGCVRPVHDRTARPADGHIRLLLDDDSEFAWPRSRPRLTARTPRAEGSPSCRPPRTRPASQSTAA